MTLNNAISVIQASDYKLTRPRQVILELIFQHSGPFSASDIAGRLARKQKGRSADVVTVYRSLAIFEKLRILCRCEFSDVEAMYEIQHSEMQHHHHVVCKICNRVEPLDFCVIQGQELILKKLGYRELDHRLEFRGICPKCASAKSSS